MQSNAARRDGSELCEGLGPLPTCAQTVVYNESKGYSFDAYTAEQMHAYAAQAVAAERERIAAWLEVQRNDVPATGAEFAAALRADRA
jgi:hypothetical protein